MQRVAVLGLGTMGSGMAQNILKAGFPLTVYNRTPAKAEPLAAAGATFAPTPREAVADAFLSNSFGFGGMNAVVALRLLRYA